MEENNNKQFEDPPIIQNLPKPHLVNGVPVSYVDDSDGTPAPDPIAAEIEKNTAPPPPKAVTKRKQVKQAPPPPEEEPVEEEEVVDQPKTAKSLSGKNAISMFKQAVGAGVIPVKIFSTGEEVMMRELTVTDQKTLSKTALINKNRRDVMYNAQNSLLNTCMQTKGFDIKEYTEFDRITLLLCLYQQNYFSNEIKYTCPKCGKENKYKLDFGAMLHKVGKSWSPDRTYVMKHGSKEFHFTIGWPKVSIVSEFYTSYYRQYNSSNDNTKSTLDQLSNVEYLTMFIRKVELYVDGKSEGVSLNLDDYGYADRSDLIDSLPQGLVFDDKEGVMSKIIADFTNPLNKAFQYENCQFCGAETEEGIGSIADFT